MIAAFHASPEGNLLGVEEQLRAVPDLKLPDVLAQVDLVHQGDDALLVVDFKTSRSKWDEQDVQQAAEQLLIYGHTVKPLAVCLELPVRLHFVIVTKAASPCVQGFDAPLNEQRLGALPEGTLQVWESMKAGNFYPSPSAQNCTSCPFKSRCPIFDGR